jgi:hypothetical protein
MSDLFTAETLAKFVSNQSFLIMLISIMVISGIMKTKGILEPIYSILVKYIPNRRVLLSILTTIYGVLPVPSRVTVTAALLDTMVDKTKDNRKMGLLSYIATHHYYLWSPLEKSVLICMAGLGLTYSAFIGYMIIPVILSFAVIFGYIFWCIKDEDIIGFHVDENAQMSWSKRVDFLLLTFFLILNACSVFADIKLGSIKISGMAWSAAFFAIYLVFKHIPSRAELASFVNWKLVSFTALVITAGWLVGFYANSIQDFIKANAQGYGVFGALIIGFAAAFALGSSSRYAAIAVILTKIFGMPFFLLFFIVEYAGYLLSPTHKCMAIGQLYFNTRLRDTYAVVGFLVVVLITFATVYTLV